MTEDTRYTSPAGCAHEKISGMGAFSFPGGWTAENHEKYGRGSCPEPVICQDPACRVDDGAFEPMTTEPPEDPNRWEDVWFWRNKARGQ